MAIPHYQTIMLPLLRLCADREEHSLREALKRISEEFDLSDEEQRELLPSGRMPIYNRVGWARTYLAKAGLLHAPKRGIFAITDQGLELLKDPPPRMTAKFLERFDDFKDFRRQKRTNRVDGEQTEESSTEATPEELLEDAFQRLRESLADELLGVVKGCSPDFFERLVLELLLAMGYGGSRQEAGQQVGGSGDGGIDGIIKEDRLGLDVVYIQAKRWENTVGRPEVQKFVGALQGQRARKGVFITTSDFSWEAKEYAGNLESKVVLMDGGQLARLMIDFDIGVSRSASYEVKKVDTDYFDEE